MNILWYFLAGYGGLIAGYKLLKPSVERIIRPDDRKTAAVLYEDGEDFVPTPRPVLFGHHFMSIAGTSPIIAAIVGLAWGWVPAFLWMVLGVCFIGGVHDYFSTMISSRDKGKSIGQLVNERIGKRAGMTTSALMAFGGILVYAIFLSVVAGTLESIPTSVIPTVALIPIAMLYGVMTRKGVSVPAASLAGFVLTIACIFIGLKIPIHATKTFWIWAFAIYTFFASYLPVWLLLQPRDYLSTLQLLGGLAVGFVGFLAARPAIQFPAFIGWNAASGPLWPILFATISCGAASGWHNLVTTGTTSKQLRHEKDGFPIAYAGMQGETVVGLLTSAMIIALIGIEGYPAALANPGGTFSTALGKAMSFIGIPEMVGVTFGALSLSALTLTTMDSYARASRYVIQELAAGTVLEKTLPSSILVTVSGLVLMFSVPYMDLWAGLVLGGLLALVFPFLILHIERVRKNQPLNGDHMIHVLLPLVFVYVTSYAALFYKLFGFVKTGQWLALAMTLFLMVGGAVAGIEGLSLMKKPLDEMEVPSEK